MSPIDAAITPATISEPLAITPLSRQELPIFSLFSHYIATEAFIELMMPLIADTPFHFACASIAIIFRFQIRYFHDRLSG
jgi:hypothetical protein